MSSYAVVAAVSEALRRLLWESLEPEPVLKGIVGSESAIALKNPTETARDSSNRLSLWLYQITENEFTKNQPLETTARSDTRRFPPLTLNLHYLLTPFAPTSEADHLVLGRAMQVFYDNAIVFLRDIPNEITEELRIVLCRMTLEELTRIWEALREPYRLSLCYLVRITHVDSVRTVRGARVIERIAGFGHEAGEPVEVAL